MAQEASLNFFFCITFTELLLFSCKNLTVRNSQGLDTAFHVRVLFFIKKGNFFCYIYLKDEIMLMYFLTPNRSTCMTYFKLTF